MKKIIPIFYILSLILICSCAQGPIEEAFIKNISVGLTKEADSLLSKSTEEITYINEANWPVNLRKLNPRKVYATNDGLYIKISERFVEESGIFIARQDINKEFKQGEDPSYRRIENRIYYYHIKG